MERARPATADDVPRLVELARELRAELIGYRGGTLWATDAVATEPLDEAIGEALARPDTTVLVGAIDDVTVGYAVVTVDTLVDGSRLGRMAELFVEEGARSVGVGEALAQAVLEVCRASACRGIDVVALPGHRATKNFFEEQGFTARAIVMHRDLSQ